MTLYNEDCFLRLKEIKDNYIDDIVTNPPYGIGFSGVTSDTSFDNMSDEQYENMLT